MPRDEAEHPREDGQTWTVWSIVGLPVSGLILNVSSMMTALTISMIKLASISGDLPSQSSGG